MRNLALAALAAVSGVLGAAGWLVSGALVRCRGSVSCALWIGEPLLEVHAPGAGPVRGGVPIVVRFPDRARVAPDTFRCLLDGVDVTPSLTTAADGVRGAIYPSHAGPMELRLSIFGEGAGLGAGRWIEHTVLLRIDVRGDPATLDRADHRLESRRA